MPALRPLVVKFGGAALEDLPRLSARVRSVLEEGAPVVLVVSARAGVTDLLQSITLHPGGSRRRDRIVSRVAALHPGLPDSGTPILERIRGLADRIEKGTRHHPVFEDELLSQGERLSAHWLTVHLREGGIPACAVESDRIGLMTGDLHGSHVILVERSARAVRRGLHPILRSKWVPVVTGYFGRSIDGQVMTLGRGGSDYSASAIGAILGAERVELVKREASVMTADPNVVPEARPLPSLSYEEAEELAQFGARVLHPMTIQPARNAGIPLWVRSLADPFAVTVIGAASGRRHRAFTLLAPLSLVTVRAAGGRERPGLLGLLGTAVAGAGVNVVTVFTSSALVSFVVPPERAEAAIRCLHRLGGLVMGGPKPVALVTAIGEGVLEDLPRVPLSLLLGAHGMSAGPISISIVVRSSQSGSSLRTLHQALIDPPNSSPSGGRGARGTPTPVARPKAGTASP